MKKIIIKLPTSDKEVSSTPCTNMSHSCGGGRINVLWCSLIYASKQLLRRIFSILRPVGGNVLQQIMTSNIIF